MLGLKICALAWNGDVGWSSLGKGRGRGAPRRLRGQLMARLCRKMRQESEDVGLRAVPTAVRGGWEGVEMGRGRRYRVGWEVLHPGAMAEHPELEVISQLVNGDAPAERLVLPRPPPPPPCS